MAYSESLAALARSAEAHGIALSVETPDGERSTVETIFGDALAAAIDEAGYPGGLEVPLSAEDLYLYPLAELEQRQIGYRTDANSGGRAPGWDQERYVIADWAANPVSIGRDGGLAYSVHGRGTWDYRPIAPDLGAFLSVLARWIDYYRGERGGKILDDDFEVLPEVARQVRQDVMEGLSEREADNFSDFLLGTI